MIAEYFSREMIKGKVPIGIKFIIQIMTLRRNVLSKKLGYFQYYENIEGITEYNIDKNSFDSNKRKNGVSLFARLKNGEDFLEQTVLSHEPFVDEIILVDNNSNDNTKEICKNLTSKFPEKIKYYEYSPEVYPVGHKNWKDTKNNSVHALSYYYNWTISKTTYKYVAKLDDDMIIYNKTLFQSKIEEIKKNGLKYLEIFPQLNISEINGNLMTPISQPISKILPPIAGLYLDHGIFPISEKTFFINDKTMETFIFPFNSKINPITLLHLKGMKKGIKNWQGDMKNLAKNIFDNSKYIDLPEKYKKHLDFL